MISFTVNKTKLRGILFIGALLIAVFAIIDLRMMPEILHRDYLQSRLVFQIPTLLLLIAFTYHKRFEEFQQLATLTAISIVTFSNYWLIQTCWIKAGFAFSYEGTLLYTFFAFFVIRINFTYGLIYVILSLIGFAALVAAYPVYGEYNSVNFGFVAMAQIICLFGLYSLSDSLAKVHRLTAKLQELSRIDQLSGLYNRRAYEQDGKLLFEQAKRLKLSVSIFMIDIDNFKDYNDAYGHQKGDEAIRVQANILKSVFKRESDIIGRFGGEEFIVIANNMTTDASERMAQNILSAWQRERIPHGKGAGGRYLSCSIGIMNIIPYQEMTFNELIGLADEALYTAKSEGRNRYQIAKAAS
jgi:diguanylate cyclase (GGDEF)-like protein